LLEVLAERDAKATFFVIGRKVDANRELCRRIIAEGHTLGNHTQSHLGGAWWTLPQCWIRREIVRASHAIRAATGVRPRYFRSPVGMSSAAVHGVVRECGLRLVGWSASGSDGCPAAPSIIVQRIMNAVKPGAIILLHESGVTASAKSRRRRATLTRLLDSLEAGGYRCELPDDRDLF